MIIVKKNLYQIIVDDLAKAIHSGELAANTKVPTEQELAQRYQVSRITSKRALNELEQAGLIYRKQGSGSFVQPEQQTINDAPVQQPMARPKSKLDISYIVIPNESLANLAVLATQLLLRLNQNVETNFRLITTTELVTNLANTQLNIQQVLLLGDHYDENTIYQLYQYNIFFYQVATLIDPLERPQIILSMTGAIQNLLQLLPTTTTHLFYYTDAKHPAAFSDQALKIPLLKSMRQYADYHLQFCTEKEALSDLAPTDILLFENFYTLLDYVTTQPATTQPIYLLAWQLTAEQCTFLQTHHIQTFYIDSTYLVKMCHQFLMRTKKDVSVMQNITVNAKSLLPLDDTDQSFDL